MGPFPTLTVSISHTVAHATFDPTSVISDRSLSSPVTSLGGSDRDTDERVDLLGRGNGQGQVGAGRLLRPLRAVSDPDGDRISAGSILAETVPESTPVELSLSPLGKRRVLIHLYGGVPPDALNCSL